MFKLDFVQQMTSFLSTSYLNQVSRVKFKPHDNHYAVTWDFKNEKIRIINEKKKIKMFSGMDVCKEQGEQMLQCGPLFC